MQTNILSTLAVCLGLVSATLTCKSESQPNPIAASSGLNITGTINGTLAVLPIPLAQAQSIVGSKYTIQTAVYRSLIPSLPEDTYPALLQAVLDHDVQAAGIGIPDFTRISIEYPFLSMPGANSTSLFRLANTQLMTATNAVALTGSASYGTRVIPASFDPPCDAYAYTDPPSSINVTTTHLNANHPIPVDGGALFTTTFSTLGVCGDDDGNAGCEMHESPYPLSFFANVTNQPSFADPAKGCDYQRRDFDTVVTMAPWEPVPVRGEVWASKDVFGDEDAGTTWKGVWGVRVDTAFLEINYQKCETL